MLKPEQSEAIESLLNGKGVFATKFRHEIAGNRCEPRLRAVGFCSRKSYERQEKPKICK